jgi:hypothetical protein
MKKCSICGRTEAEIARFIRHHVSYEKDKTVILCHICHEWAHHRRVWKHPVFDPMGKDKGVLAFAKGLVKIYKGA